MNKLLAHFLDLNILHSIIMLSLMHIAIVLSSHLHFIVCSNNFDSQKLLFNISVFIFGVGEAGRGHMINDYVYSFSSKTEYGVSVEEREF